MMSEPAPAARAGRRSALLLWMGLALIIALPLLLWLLPKDNRPLKPLREPSQTSPINDVFGQPVLISFAELDNDPFAMRNQRLRMTGTFTRVESPTCLNAKGPWIQWAIVDDLQLNAVGYETILESLPEGTTMTVDGIWRLYEGPAGCGKAPENKAIWFLEVEQIVQPNPLFGANGAVPTPLSDTASGADASPPAPSVGDDRVAPVEDGTGPVATASATETPMPATTSTVTAAPPTREGVTNTPIAPSVTSVAATSEPGSTPPPTVPPSATAPAGQPTQAATETASPPPAGASPTSTPFPTSPPLLTATPGDSYPGPASTPTPTETPQSYP
jgi:hypothetical protein